MQALKDRASGKKGDLWVNQMRVCVLQSYGYRMTHKAALTCEWKFATRRVKQANMGIKGSDDTADSKDNTGLKGITGSE
eukprot:2824335-Alexandrium_andersonii.AAC.1